MVAQFGFEKRSFAGPLKEFAYAADPYVELDFPVAYPGLWDVEFVRLSVLVDAVGWDQAKRHKDVRRFLQRGGTEGGRGVLSASSMSASLWVDLAEAGLSDGDIVFQDVRFDNEAHMIRRLGGEVWEIHRPGVDALDGPEAQHPSEAGVDPALVDCLILNDGTVDLLLTRITDLLPHAV